MRVRVSKVTCLTSDYAELKQLFGEKGEFELGHARLEDCVLTVWASFKPFDPKIKAQGFHAVSLKQVKNKIAMATKAGNFLSFEVLP